MDINPVHRQMQIANQPIEQLANNKSISESEKNRRDQPPI